MESGRFGEAFASDAMPRGQSFALQSSRSDDMVWLALGGELDVFATPTLRAALREVEMSRPSVIVFDMRGLQFLDSSGLAVLLGAHERAVADGDRSVKLVISGSRAVEALFTTLRAADFLDIIEGPAELTAGSRT